MSGFDLTSIRPSYKTQANDCHPQATKEDSARDAQLMLQTFTVDSESRKSRVAEILKAGLRVMPPTD